MKEMPPSLFASADANMRSTAASAAFASGGSSHLREHAPQLRPVDGTRAVDVEEVRRGGAPPTSRTRRGATWAQNSRR